MGEKYDWRTCLMNANSGGEWWPFSLSLVAESEEDVYRPLGTFELEGKVVNSLVSEMFQFVSAYRASDDELR